MSLKQVLILEEEKMLPDGLVWRVIAAGPSSALCSLGITAHVDESLPSAALASSEVVVDTTDSGPPLFKDGAVHVDGSCLAQWGRQHARAAYAAVQINEEGAVVRAISRLVPRA